MQTNANATLYKRSVVNRDEAWTREEIQNVHWENRKAANVIQSGLLEADNVNIYIPFASGYYTIQPGDILVRGIVKDSVGNGFTVTDLKKKYDQVVTVRSVDMKDFGSPALRHLQIGAS